MDVFFGLAPLHGDLSTVTCAKRVWPKVPFTYRLCASVAFCRATYRFSKRSWFDAWIPKRDTFRTVSGASSDTSPAALNLVGAFIRKSLADQKVRSALDRRKDCGRLILEA
jgi:hypothetical protein